MEIPCILFFIEVPNLHFDYPVYHVVTLAQFLMSDIIKETVIKVSMNAP